MPPKVQWTSGVEEVVVVVTGANDVVVDAIVDAVVATSAAVVEKVLVGDADSVVEVVVASVDMTVDVGKLLLDEILSSSAKARSSVDDVAVVIVTVVSSFSPSTSRGVLAEVSSATSNRTLSTLASASGVPPKVALVTGSV